MTRMRFSLALLGVCCLALLGLGAASGSADNLWGLIGKWQGVCVTKGYNGACEQDIISWPYYVEYSFNSSYNQFFQKYRWDGVKIDAPKSNSYYESYDYSDTGTVKVYKNYDGLCVDVENYDYDVPRTYRAKIEHKGELDVLIEEGPWAQKQNPSRQMAFHTGVAGSCPSSSWQSLKCDMYTYTTRCYLVRTNSWSWSW